MAHARLEMVGAHVGRQAGAEIVRRHGLAHGADVVPFAFHRQERGFMDRFGANLAAPVFKLAPPE